MPTRQPPRTLRQSSGTNAGAIIDYLGHPGDSGKVLGNNGVVVGWQIGIPSLAGKASKFLKANGGETDVLFADAAEVPIGSPFCLRQRTLLNTVTAQGATYLKTGVISNRATYPAAQLKSYTLCSTASTTPAESLYCLYGVASRVSS